MNILLMVKMGKRVSYHTVEVGDSGILVGIGVEQHLGIGMDGYVRFHTFLVLAQELSNSLDFRLRLREGTTVGVITGVRGGTLIWGRGEYKSGLQPPTVFHV